MERRQSIQINNMIQQTVEVDGFDIRPNIRRHIRNLYPKFITEISDMLEKILLLMKQFKFSLFDHKNLLLICEFFIKVDSNLEQDITPIHQISNNINCKNIIDRIKSGDVLDCFIQVLYIWIEEGNNNDIINM